VSTPGKSFDPATVSRATWIAAGGAFVLFISVFLSWYGASVAGFSVSANGWDAVDLAKLIALLALIALAVIVIEVFVPTVTLPVPASMVVIGCGGLSVLFVLLKIIDKPSGGLDLKYGIFVALIAAAVTTYGGYAKMNEA
jgi:hypothetical protein